MNLLLYIQKPKPSKKPLIGYLDIHFKDAFFFDDEANLHADLAQPEIISANSVGIKLRGFEEMGTERTGNPKYRYQEWWLVYQVGGMN